MSRLQRIDDGIARGEAAIAAFVLLFMILLAATQAVFQNLANLGVVFANDALTELDWIDAVLQKGTLWLAFIGASLATHADKHIAIDALSRLMPGRVRTAVKGVVNLAAGITAFFLSRVFFSAVVMATQERPLEYEVLTNAGSVHICQASVQGLADAALDRPDVFCGLRWVLTEVGAPVETPVGALQLIVPAMFLLIAARLVARSVRIFRGLGRGEPDGMPAPAKRPLIKGGD